ncbi:MAG: methionyl aminopeptidase [Patescibacteria group bacterium]|jgi:methionyl aminopeptidase|nr:methionyl aminopeptidase [Patescibacteria group bacterium]
MKTQVKTAEEIRGMRASGKILATILAELMDQARVGMQTKEIDQLARTLLEKHNAEAAFLGYQGFPGAICISINDEIAHGIPGDRVMETGDLVHFDFGVRYQGMITDAGRSFVLGAKPTEDQARLLTGTQKALDAAIALVQDGVRIGDLGAAVEATCDRYDLKIVYELCGHGVGHTVHEEPTIMNYGMQGTGERLKAGWTVALEPNVSLGSHDMYLADNGWTWITKDGSLAAQFEHTVLITDTGVEVLTKIND